MLSIVAPNGFSCVVTLTLCFFFGVIAQTKGQSSGQQAHFPVTLSAWGVDSIHRRDLEVRGAASCATSSCHGGPKAGVSSVEAPRGSEYPLWFEADPHARSWKTLSSESSMRILTKLGIWQDGKIANLAGYQNCLACHNTDQKLGADQISPRIAEGVGCESCHGPSEHWYNRHYQGKESKRIAIASLGLTDSGPLLNRAKLCAACHVGSKDRDMNHDIIAAGHPALYFDMAVYHEAYPKHWRDAEQENIQFRSQLWLAGQIASAASELELLESRACKSLPVSTWPELSNFQCNSCHLALDGIPKPARSSDRDRIRTGRAPIRNWNLSGLSSLPRSSNGAEDDIMASARELRSLLEEPKPDPIRVAGEARKLSGQLVASLYGDGKLILPTWSRQTQLARTIQLMEETKRSNSWETAAVAYTAAWATHPKMADDSLAEALRTLRNGLLFPSEWMVPNFPRLQNSTPPPNLKEWDDSLQRVTSVLIHEEQK